MTNTNQPKLTKAEAMELFRQLVAQYGLQWTAKVPAAAWTQMNRVNEVLDEGDRREAMGWRR